MLFELKLYDEEVRKPSLGLQGVKRRMFQSVPWYSDEDRHCVPLAERKNLTSSSWPFSSEYPGAILKDIPAHVTDVMTDSQTLGFS